METFTLRWSADRSLYFVEPSRGRNVRGFWLGAEKKDFPVPPEMIRNPYSGAMAFEGYWRQWFSMRGFIVQQGDPQTKVPARSELVSDYLADAHMVTGEEADRAYETARIEAAAAAREADRAYETARIEAAAAAREVELKAHQEYLRGQHQQRIAEVREAAGWTAVREAEEALDLIEKSSGAHLINREGETAQESAPAEQANPRPLPERKGEQEKKDDDAAAGFSSGGRPPKHGRGKR
jgi:hypothetical protein